MNRSRKLPTTITTWKFPAAFRLAATIGLFLAIDSACLALADSGVNYSAPKDLPFVGDAAGTALPDGNEVRVGFFDDGFVPADNADDLAALQAAWNQYDNTDIRVIESQPGRFGESASSGNSAFDGKKIYLWIFKTSDAAFAAGDFSNVQEYGLFSAPIPRWFFPPVGGLPGQTTTNITSADVTETVHASLDTGKLLLAAVPITYDTWAADPAVFPMGTAAADKLPTANPDKDALDNLEEFFHFRNPLAPDGSPLEWDIQIHENPREVEVTFPRRKNLAGVQFRIETAPNLTGWTTIAGATETILSDPAADPETVRLDFQIPTEDECYFRAVITLLP